MNFSESALLFPSFPLPLDLERIGNFDVFKVVSLDANEVLTIIKMFKEKLDYLVNLFALNELFATPLILFDKA